MKTCKKCGEDKDVSQFSKKKATKDGLQYECKTCRNAYNKEWRVKNDTIKKRRTGQLKHKYNMSVDDYNKMFIKQRGICAICSKPEKNVDNRTGKIKWLSVDHCHSTDVVRGLLCSDCNAGIGMLGDNIKTLESAIKYLKERGSYGK